MKLRVASLKAPLPLRLPAFLPARQQGGACRTAAMYLYSVLKLHKTCTAAEIKIAYRQLVSHSQL